MKRSPRYTLLFALLVFAACKSDPDTRDAGKKDSGEGPIILDAGLPADAAYDAGAFADAAIEDATSEDATSEDATSEDALGEDAAGEDANTDGGAPDALPFDGGMSAQSGELIFTEFLANASGFEFVEVQNTSAGQLDVATYSIAVVSHGPPVVIHAASDPTGANATPVLLAAGASALGVPNPADPANIPADAALVFGAPGAFGTDALNDGGDYLLILSPAGLSDEVDFRVAATGPSTLIGPADFPILRDVPTALDPPASSALGNDDARSWCAPLYSSPTRGAANTSCGAFVLSEVLYDFASVTTGDDLGNEMLELAGPAGAALAGTHAVVLDGAGAVLSDVALPAERMPLSGVFVIGDDAGGSSTFVPNADQIATLGLSDGSGAVQLVRTVELLDAFGYGMLPPNLVDEQRGLAAYEGTPAADIDVETFSACWVRSEAEGDSGNNTADFRYDPTPTPGARNGARTLMIASLEPNDALATHATTIELSGAEFTDAMTVLIGSEAASCTVLAVDRLSCAVNYPATGSGNAERLDVTVSTRTEHGAQVVLPNAFTWTTSRNETTTSEECDFCNLQFPDTIAVAANQDTQLIYGRIYEAGLTDVTVGGPAPNILAELGYGPAGSNPTTDNTWIWHAAVFNAERGPSNNDDEYQSTLRISTPGNYLYTYRFSLDGGLSWSCGDFNGAGSNSGQDFETGQLGTLTVN